MSCVGSTRHGRVLIDQPIVRVANRGDREMNEPMCAETCSKEAEDGVLATVNGAKASEELEVSCSPCSEELLRVRLALQRRAAPSPSSIGNRIAARCSTAGSSGLRLPAPGKFKFLIARCRGDRTPARTECANAQAGWTQTGTAPRSPFRSAFSDPATSTEFLHILSMPVDQNQHFAV